MTIGNQAFCLALCLTGVYFRGKLQHVGDVMSKKSNVNQSELEKQVVSDCNTNYMEVSDCKMNYMLQPEADRLTMLRGPKAICLLMVAEGPMF